MKLVLYIPDTDIPQRQEVLDVFVHFMNGKVCECTYPFDEYEWISVCDELPAEGEQVLCTYKTPNGFDKFGITYYRSGRFIQSNVVAWMPLPELYSSEDGLEIPEENLKNCQNCVYSIDRNSRKNSDGLTCFKEDSEFSYKVVDTKNKCDSWKEATPANVAAWYAWMLD